MPVHLHGTATAGGGKVQARRRPPSAWAASSQSMRALWGVNAGPLALTWQGARGVLGLEQRLLFPRQRHRGAGAGDRGEAAAGGVGGAHGRQAAAQRQRGGRGAALQQRRRTGRGWGVEQLAGGCMPWGGAPPRAPSVGSRTPGLQPRRRRPAGCRLLLSPHSGHSICCSGTWSSPGLQASSRACGRYCNSASDWPACHKCVLGALPGAPGRC